MQEIDIKVGLEYYHKYSNIIKQNQTKLEVIEARQENVSSSIIKIPEKTEYSDYSKLCALELKCKSWNEIERYEYYVLLAEDFIKSRKEPLKSLIRDKYINKRNWNWIINQYGEYDKYWERMISREMTRYINAR